MIYFSNQLDNKVASSSLTPTVVSFGSQADGSATFSNIAPKTEFAGGGYWYSAAAPIPEPTSGLLLLLGVAGLALRRRCA